MKLIWLLCFASVILFSQDCRSQSTDDHTKSVSAPPTDISERRLTREERRRLAEIRKTQREEFRRERAERRRNRNNRTEETEANKDEVTLEWLAANISSLWHLVRSLETYQEANHQSLNLAYPTLRTGTPSKNVTKCPKPDDSAECNQDLRYCSATGSVSEVCSNNGECCCGACHCEGGFQGSFCECNSIPCLSSDGQVCSGKGSCQCGKCNCPSQWTGPTCECPMSVDSCKSPSDPTAEICSGNGVCECGQCRCNDGQYKGRYCEVSPFVAGLCEQLKSCVLCFAGGDAPEGTSPHCLHCWMTYTRQEVVMRRSSSEGDTHKKCFMVHQGCVMEYSYNVMQNGTYDVTVPPDMNCK